MALRCLGWYPHPSTKASADTSARLLVHLQPIRLRLQSSTRPVTGRTPVKPLTSPPSPSSMSLEPLSRSKIRLEPNTHEQAVSKIAARGVGGAGVSLLNEKLRRWRWRWLLCWLCRECGLVKKEKKEGKGFSGKGAESSKSFSLCRRVVRPNGSSQQQVSALGVVVAAHRCESANWEGIFVLRDQRATFRDCPQMCAGTAGGRANPSFMCLPIFKFQKEPGSLA